MGYYLRGDLVEPVEGRGIDVRVGPRTGADERIDMVHCVGTRHGCVWGHVTVVVPV